jgi:hypothetical protein
MVAAATSASKAAGIMEMLLLDFIRIFRHPSFLLL